MKNLLILLFLVACWQMGYAQPISFTEQTIGFASNSLSVGHADLNNDGHMDLVSAEAVSGVLYWWKNDGLVNPSFTRIQFEGNFAQANNFVFADLNGDGTIDIINSSFTQGEVAAWLNNGEPDTPTFTKKVIKSGFASALGVAVGDLDKDGDIDVAASAQFSGAGKVIVRWNDGNLDPAFSETTLGSLASINRRALVVADYNKDGKQDVITANDGANQVKFFRNLGGQVFQQRTILSVQSQNYHAAFMNDDNDLDVLVLDQSSPATIQYYRNSGLYNPNNTNPNFSIRSVGGPVGSGSEIYPADLDNDGNMDVICASTLGPKALQWYESGGGANPSFTSYTINADPGYFGAYSYQAADLDGDGDLDIYGGEFSKMVWYENDLLEPLEITCPNDITVNTDQGECSANITVPLATVTGGCGNETINDSENGTGDASGSYDRGDNIVVYTVVDDCGNTKNCTTTITVNDNEGPQLVCRNQTIELMGFPPFDSPFTFDASDVTSVAVDNCDPETFVSAVPASISCADVGSIVEVLVTWRDNSFNETTCTAFITVEDGRGPNVLCNDPVVALGDNGEYTLTEADVLSDASSDNCGTVNFVSASPSVVDCDDVGSTIAVTVTANDGNGNTRTCTANVTVEDNEGPNLVCRNQTISLGSFPFSSPYTFSASDVTSIANGSCGNIFVGAVPAGISCADVGSTVEVLVTWRDVNFNESTCTAFITVEDGDPPFVLCNDPVVALGANGEYELTGSDVLSDASSDNCGTVNFESASPSIVDCDDIGSTVAVTVFVNDGNGNRRPCTANVTISSVAPVVPTPETLTRVRCRRETATITVADPGTDLEVVWRVLEAPAGVSFAAGDELEANVNGSDYRTDLDANGRQLRTKGQARAGIYRFQAFTRNVNTGCEGALTTEEFMITINELPAMPTADITTDAGCVGQSSGEVSVVDPGAGFTVSWEVLEAPAGATFAAEDILASNTADSHYRTNQNMNGSLLRIKS
ncbi:MAG: VCBS repeat-containing protein, partial [Bacteroidota bacterium]